MVWVVLVLAAVSWLVVALISEQERGEAVPLTATLTTALRIIGKTFYRASTAIGREGGKALARMATAALRAGHAIGDPARRSKRRGWIPTRSAAMSFAMRQPRRTRRRLVAAGSGDGWRSRLVALVELILFILLISVVFAGAMAAAAMRIGNFGT